MNKEEIINLLSDTKNQDELFIKADSIRRKNVGDEVHLRGLIEFSNICRNNCMYCGIRRGNLKACRYRMNEEDIISTAQNAIDEGFKTIVMQSGEDAYFTKDKMCRIIENVKKNDVALTLSIGERSYDDYKSFKDAGADRYLMRIETTDKELYHKLNPNMSWQKRYECLLM
ncbi:MAG: radical SAM protein, partial [Alphaproteobacteria bacterium]|nr:radical SAM protein [Alphaproteobacteria bacterium]